MPSHLTRRIFRCLLANEPIVHAGCVRAGTIVAARQRPGRPHASQARLRIPQRRTLFGIGASTDQTRDRAARSPTRANLDVLADLVRRRRLQARLPTVQDVYASVRVFLAHADENKWPLLDTQAELLVQAFRYLAEHTDDGQTVDGTSTIKTADLHRLISSTATILARTASPLPVHLELAQCMHSILPEGHNLQWATSPAVVAVLSDLDRPADAREWLLNMNLARFGTTEHASGKKARRSYWSMVRLLAALARQDSEQQLLDILAMTETTFSNLRKADHFGVVIDFYITRKDSAQVKHWVDVWLQSHQEAKRIYADKHDSSGNKPILRSVFAYAVQNSDADLGRHLVAEYPLDMLSATDFAAHWNEMAAYYFALNRSIEDIAHRIDLTQKSFPQWSPSIDTINRLLEVAIDAGDPYLAERLIALGQDRGLRPDARTLTLQMSYRLSVKDTDGALLAYKHLQNETVPADESDVFVTNRLIVALCNSGRHDFDTIMNVAADMSDRQAAFSADAVQALAIVHLKRDEVKDVEDLINTHAPKFASAERAGIRKAIKDFAIHSDTPASTMWDAYQILRNSFDEMPREERTEIMQACFAKKRTDMAVHVFNHMRQHSRKDTFPLAETYVAAFMGAAQTQDGTALTALHNQLRLDTVIDITTSMRNALMIAKLATRDPRASLRLWDDIVDSTEGPSHNSILIAFRACQFVFDGPEKSEEIWARLRRNNIELDQKLWAAYLGAVASDGGVGRAVRILQTAQKANEVDVDILVLGSIVRAARRPADAADVKLWATSEHPGPWDEVQRQMQQEGVEVYGRLDYGLEP